jgi:hypothetical protein
LYNLTFAGVILASGGLAFFVSGVSNPDATAQTWMRYLAIFASLSFVTAFGAQIAMRVFYDWVCEQAFKNWDADPSLGATVNAVLLGELIGLSQGQVWHAREFLERKAKTAGVTYQAADTPNERHYRFPRLKNQ